VQLRGGRRRGRPWRDAELVAAARGLGLDAWVWGVATFLAVYTALFTTFFTNPQGLREGLYGSIEYWLGQQPVNRGSQPWFYYLTVLPAYEWPILLLGALGSVVVLRRRTLFGLLLVWLAVTQLAVYSWASERMPWLTLHILLPFVLLAGIGVGAVWEARRRLVGGVGLVAIAVAAAFSIYTAVGLSFVRPADPRELLVFVQSSQDVTGVRREIAALDRRTMRTQGRHPVIEVDSWGGVSWPWAWYLRDLPADYVDLSTNPVDVDVDAVLVADVNRPARLRELRGFRGRRFDLREWWVVDYGQAGPGDWARWLAVRQAWTPRASLPEWLYVRRR
jgi:predicted membrane-bound mannosyltransferase